KQGAAGERVLFTGDALRPGELTCGRDERRGGEDLSRPGGGEGEVRWGSRVHLGIGRHRGLRIQGLVGLRYFRCSHPPGSKGVRVPSAAMRIMSGRLRPARRISPMQVRGTPAMARGTEAEGGAVKRSS